MLQIPQKTDKNQGGKQKTQWDSNSEGSAGEDGRWEVGGGTRGGRLGSCSLRTYLQQKGQGLGWWRWGWGLGGGEGRLHRSTGLRSWRARARRSGARGVSRLHPQLSSREWTSSSQFVKEKEKKGKQHSAHVATKASLVTAPWKGKGVLGRPTGDECVESKPTVWGEKLKLVIELTVIQPIYC